MPVVMVRLCMGSILLVRSSRSLSWWKGVVRSKGVERSKGVVGLEAVVRSDVAMGAMVMDGGGEEMAVRIAEMMNIVEGRLN